MNLYLKIQEEIEEAREEGRIEENIRVQRKFKVEDKEIVRGLMEDFNLTEEEAQEKLNEYDSENNL